MRRAVCFVFLILTVCGTIDASAQPQAMALVFCDVSRSIMNRDSCYQSMVTGSFEVLKWLCKKRSNGKFYLIHRETMSASNEPIEVSFENDTNTTYCDQKAIELVRRLTEIRENASNSPALDQSCLIDAFEESKNIFQLQGTSKYRPEIIVISDMLECCSSNILNTCFDQANVLNTASIQRATEVLHNQKPNRNFANTRITLIIISSKRWQNASVKAFWRTFFEKQGVPVNDKRWFFYGAPLAGYPDILNR